MHKTGSKKPRPKNKSSRPAIHQSASSHGKIGPQKKTVSAARTTGKLTATKPRAGRSGSAHARSGKVESRKPAPVLRREPTPEEIQHQKNLVRFEGAVRLFNQSDFQKAREAFTSLATNSAPDLAQRARVYLNICDQRLSHPVLRLKTADDFYNYAVSMANQGNREEAEINLNKALKLAPKSDYIYYALATTQALRENVEGSLENLQKAIELNARNRYLAQNDSDFENLGEDPRFTELIYPEKPM